MPNSQPTATIVASSTAGELICAAAGRISTSQGTALSILERSKEKPNNAALIEKVVSSGHHSLVEHAFFTIAFDNVSVCTEEFVIEFRLASFTVQSRRYVDFTNAGFYTPELPKQIETRYQAHMKSLFDCYGELLELGIPREDARFVLPYSFCSNFYCTLNARELMHMIDAMLWGRGKDNPELVLIGNQLKNQFCGYFPNLLNHLQSQHQNGKEISHSDFPYTMPVLPNPTSATSSVQIQYSTGEPEILIQSFADSSDLCNFKGQNRSLEEIVNDERPRELELVQVIFKIGNISLSAITHIVRHRMQTVLIPHPIQAILENRFLIPESIAANGNAKILYLRAFSNNTEVAQELLNCNMPLSALQYFALSGNLMNITCSMNGRELQHFFALRTCQRAQWEVRAIAKDLLMQLRKKSPSFYGLLGPGCVTSGICPEGRLSCGKAEIVRKEFE